MEVIKYQIALKHGEDFILSKFNLRFKKGTIVEAGEDAVEYLKNNNLDSLFSFRSVTNPESENTSSEQDPPPTDQKPKGKKVKE